MDTPEIILMPGLDGMGALFAPLLAIMPANLPRRVISYPPVRAMGYDDLLELVIAQLAGDRPLILIAESFSGPLALRYAAAQPARVRAIVLCASFVSSPVPRWLRNFVRPVIFRLPVPTLALRILVLGWRSPPALVRAAKHAISRVSPAVLSHRLRQVLTLDCSDALAKSPSPILYLRAQQDRLVRLGSVQRLLAARGDLIVKEVRGPHMLLQASPVAAWHEIESFLRQRSIGIGPAAAEPSC